AVAVTTLSVGPMPTTVPASVTCVIATEPQLSLASVVATKLGRTAEQPAPAEADWAGPHCVIVGGVVSTPAVIVAPVVAVEPFASVTVTEYAPATTPTRSSVVAPFDHSHAYGVLPPLVVTAIAPSAPVGQVVFVTPSRTIATGMPRHVPAAGWKPSCIAAV